MEKTIITECLFNIIANTQSDKAINPQLTHVEKLVQLNLRPHRGQPITQNIYIKYQRTHLLLTELLQTLKQPENIHD